MSYFDPLSGALDNISQIQATLSSLPTAAGSGGFEAVMQQIASISDLGGATAPSTPDLSGSYGWPLAEGEPLGQAAGDNAAGAGDYTAGAPGAGNLQSASGGFPASEEFDAPLLGAAGTNASPSGLFGAGGDSTSPGLAPGPATGQDLGQEAVSLAGTFVGVPYLWGGTDPQQGVDCSGLVQDVFARLGISLPRTSQEQATVGTAVNGLAAAEPGDLVFYPGTDGTAAAPGHVGIYIGNGEMIDAPHTGADVRVDPVGSPTEIRRVTDMTAVAGTDGSVAGGTPLYGDDFAAAAGAYGVPQALLQAVASTESSFQPGAVSPAGAEGLMQLMPSTASSLGVDAFNPGQSIFAASKLLSSYYSQYGSWPLALAAYNAGPAAVQQYSGVPPYPETQAYIQNVLARAGMEAQ